MSRYGSSLSYSNDCVCMTAKHGEMNGTHRLFPRVHGGDENRAYHIPSQLHIKSRAQAQENHGLLLTESAFCKM